MLKILVGLALSVSLFGQFKVRWAESCFKNPTSVVCKEHEWAVKPTPPEKTPPSVINNPSFSPTSNPSNTAVVSSNQAAIVPQAAGIDWRFADPMADGLIGFNFGTLTSSPIARWMMTYLGATQGVSAADMEKFYTQLAAVDQAAVSIRKGQFVALLTGRVTQSPIPAAPGVKAILVAENVMLLGNADAVDQALRRIRTNSAPGELAWLAAQRSATSDLWAVGTPALAGQQAVSNGVKRLSLGVSIQDGLTADIAFEFATSPTAAKLRAMQGPIGKASIEGASIHLRMAMEPAELQQKLPEIAAAIGPQLGILLNVGHQPPAQARRAPVR